MEVFDLRSLFQEVSEILPPELYTKFCVHMQLSKKIHNFYQIHNKRFSDPKGSKNHQF